MNATVKSLGIDQLGVEERLALVEEIWDSIGAVPSTEAQSLELQARLLDDDANPDDVTAWEEVRTATIARLKK